MMTLSGTEVKRPNNANLQALLLPIKQKDKIPTLKKNMIQCYKSWNYQPYLAMIPDEMEIKEGTDEMQIEEGSKCDDSKAMGFNGEVVGV